MHVDVSGWVGGWRRVCEAGHQDSLGSTSSNDLNVFGKKKTRKKVLKVSSEELAARLRLSCLLGFNTQGSFAVRSREHAREGVGDNGGATESHH